MTHEVYATLALIASLIALAVSIFIDIQVRRTMEATDVLREAARKNLCERKAKDVS